MKSTISLGFLAGFGACAALLALTAATWSPTKGVPESDVDLYYPGSEDLKPDEMRIASVGSVSAVRGK